MSASRMPTRRPFAFSASARLTAVVDLPTPPLPLATATIASTPGTPALPPPAAAGRPPGAARGGGRGRPAAGRGGAGAARPCDGAALLLGGQHHHGAFDAGDALDRRSRRPGGAAPCRWRQLGRHGDREHHLAAGDEDVGDEAEGDDIALAVGSATERSRSRTCSLLMLTMPPVSMPGIRLRTIATGGAWSNRPSTCACSRTTVGR